MNNELISGQTFYKFFRKNSEKSNRKKTQINFTGNKNGNITSSQNFLFDSKNMNSYLIMSKTMGGTKEGFFKHKNVIYSADPIKNEKEIKNNFSSKDYSHHEEQKTFDKNINNNININNLKTKGNDNSYINVLIENEYISLKKKIRKNK